MSNNHSFTTPNTEELTAAGAPTRRDFLVKALAVGG
ncbi:MAG: hypothetical protein JWR65_339, partial [Massilia sp.]|nr:hypothetical protein [Massilia sp.]